MRGVNKVIIIGTACADTEIRYMPNGNAVANVTLATNESWTDKQSGQKVEKAEFHRVVMFGKVAEIAGNYVLKGSPVYIEGKLQTRDYEKDGIKRYTTEIVVDIQGTLQLLGSKPQEGQAQQSQPQRREQRARPEQAPLEAPDDFDSDIPF